MLKKSLIIVYCLIALLSSWQMASAEVKTIEADGYYIVGEGIDERQDIAKERARNQAKIRASEMAGVLVEGISETQSNVLTRDDVKIVTASVMKIKSEKISMAIIENNAIQYQCHIVALVDTENISGYLAGQVKKLDELTQRKIELEEANAKLTKEVIQLKEKYSKASTSVEKNTLIQRLSANENQYEANALVEKALELRGENDFSGAEKVCKKAIELSPQCYQAYTLLGQIYEYQGYAAMNAGRDGTDKYNLAIKYYGETLLRVQENTPYFYYAQNGMARTHRWLGEKEVAYGLYLGLLYSPNYHGYSTLAAWSLASMCYNDGDYDSAIFWGEEGLQKEKSDWPADINNRREICLILVKIYKHKGDIAQASKYKARAEVFYKSNC